MERSVIILAGGTSQRFSQCKAFAELRGKPLVAHVFERVHRVVDEVLIVVSSEEQKEPFLRLFAGEAKVVVDKGELHSPLVGALTGFENSSGDYSLLLPCDAPFVSKEILELLFDICTNVDAVIPRWPNGYIEPLHAVYRTKSAANAARMALSARNMDMRSMISLLRKVRYVSTIVLKQFDPHLNALFNVNTRLDLMKAERTMERGGKGKDPIFDIGV